MRSARRAGLLLLLVSACAPPAPVPQDPAPATLGVQPGDHLLVAIPNEAGYSGEFPVDERGRVSLPLLGQVPVAGRAPEALTDSLVAALHQYLSSPSIQITVLHRVSISGEVGRPGFYFADGTMTVGQVIALAGGPTALAKRNRIQLQRGHQTIVSDLDPSGVLQRTRVQSGDQVFVPQRGWWSRNGQYFLVGAISVASAVTAAILVRR